jgi:tetratricopeptide (TPR) repeat protein
MLLPLLAWAYLDLGETACAEELAAEAVARATEETYRLALSDAHRIRGLVAQRTGDWHEAEAALKAALDFAHAVQLPYAEAKAQCVLAQLHAAQGDPVRARRCCEAALAICHRLGERLYAGHVARALAALDDG